MRIRMDYCRRILKRWPFGPKRRSIIAIAASALICFVHNGTPLGKSSSVGGRSYEIPRAEESTCKQLTPRLGRQRYLKKEVVHFLRSFL